MENLKDLIDASSKFLLTDCKAENGFFSQVAGVGRGSTPSTANAILALFLSNRISEEEAEVLVEEMFSFQYPPQSKYGYSFCTEEVSSVWATSKAIYTALYIAPKKANQPRITRSIEWLIENRNSDFGWGYRKDEPSRQYYTFFASQCLFQAWSVSTNQTERLRYETVLKTVSDYTINSRDRKGLWTNGVRQDTCPVNTLMACATLKIIQPISQIDIEPYVNKSTLQFIKSGLCKTDMWQLFTWEEPGIAYKRIQAFPPGKVDIVLNLFDPLDEVVSFLIGWIRTNVVTIHNSSAGWFPPGATSDKPYSWSTARCLLSLATYANTLKQYVDPFIVHKKEETPPGTNYEIVDKRVFRGLVLFVGGLISIGYSSLIVPWIIRSIEDSSKQFDFMNLADSIASFLLLIVPLALFWLIARNLIKLGRIDFLTAIKQLRNIMSRLLFWQA